MNRRAPSCLSGFTLIELSIVIVIIGLILAVITFSVSLTRLAGARKQATQIELIESGVQNFRNKYDCYPGDCVDPSVISGYTYTGNGDGYLRPSWNDDENKGFWLHLTLSKMISDSLITHSVLSGMRVPKMAINPLGVINAYGTADCLQNLLEFDTTTVNGALKTREIMFIDKKMDDGVPGSGSVRSTGFGSGSTTVYAASPVLPISTSANSGSTQCISSGVYSEAATTGSCNMIFILGD